MSTHSAWRAAFAIVPVPILLFVAVLTLLFGKDCPAGHWRDRHSLIGTPSGKSLEAGHVETEEPDAIGRQNSRNAKEKMHSPSAKIHPVNDGARSFLGFASKYVDFLPSVQPLLGLVFTYTDARPGADGVLETILDTAVPQRLTSRMAAGIFSRPHTWLCAL